ncbi:molybdopterin synthase catalytic subunit [Halioglobus japonicus]|nr:molybdopterin synthase catalytic subunit [Halioglobus japonicus]
MPHLSVSVQTDDFDVRQLQRDLLAGANAEGAVATFTGYVRAENVARDVYSMELEHYPGMTEKSIRDILEQSCKRWPVMSASVVHRVGKLMPGEQIVWVGISSAHREASFAACEFAMDYLKTRAPFWKRELGPDGATWVEARASDSARAGRW